MASPDFVNWKAFFLHGGLVEYISGDKTSFGTMSGDFFWCGAAVEFLVKGNDWDGFLGPP